MGRGSHCARRLCELNRAFFAKREVLPINPYGDWNKSFLVNENIVNEISIYLLSLGNDISAKKLMDFLHRADIKEKYGIDRNISHKTACRYLQGLGYRYHSMPKGQYVDGHEREDVVIYREKVFLPKWKKFMDRMATGQGTQGILAVRGNLKQIIAWFHDESIFYAHDRRKKGWYHKDASAKPYAKGEGASLMIADFVSADFGWLTSPDGKQSARRLFKPGKNRDGYFSNDDIIGQANEAVDILQEFYPEYEHVLIYDNATTHLKRAEDALSARKMPKGIPKPGTNWGIEVSKRNPITGKIVYLPDGSIEKTKILMQDGRFENGEPQPLYFPMDYPDENLRGKFKGMAVILQERGFGDMSKVRASCKSFKCKPGETRCCCRRMLYNQPDFADAESLLETSCHARGVHIIFLPKFHCELNFIEQCWGRAKSVYRTYPPSSKEDDLEANTLQSLASIPLPMMRKFATRSRRFMDAYDRGLNGKQAAWAARKYRGHRVLPENILDELEKEGI
jgi:transposase